MDAHDFVKKYRGPALEALLTVLQGVDCAIPEEGIFALAVQCGYNVGRGNVSFYVSSFSDYGILEKIKQPDAPIVEKARNFLVPMGIYPPEDPVPFYVLSTQGMYYAAIVTRRPYLRPEPAA